MAVLPYKSKYFPAALAAATVLILAFSLWIFPSLNKNRLLNIQISREKAKLMKYRQLLDNAEKIRENYRKLPFSQASAEFEESMVSTMAQIDSLAKTANITINELRPETESAEGFDHKISFAMRTESNIEGYFKFIARLESRSDLFSIDKLILNAKSQGTAIDGNFYISRTLAAK